MSTLISALPKSDDEREENKGEELCCTECDKKGFFCDGIEKCDTCGEDTCYECDPEGKQIGDDWVCSACQEDSEEEEEDEDDDKKSANSSTYGEGCRRICRKCGEECSCWNYNDDHEVICEDCEDDEEDDE